MHEMQENKYVSIHGEGKMFITTKAVYDIETGKCLECEGYEYDGPIAECKGESTAQSQLDLQNQLAAQQQAAENQRLNSVSAAVSPYLSGNVGYTADQLAAMNSQALDQNAQRYNQAGTATRSNLLARGDTGQTPLSGRGVSDIATLQSGKASDLSNSLRQVTLNNANQALTNQQNAVNALNGQAQTLAGNVSNYNSGAQSALGSYVTAANAPGFFQSLGTSLAGGLGGAVGKGIAGGAGTAASSLGSGSWGW